MESPQTLVQAPSDLGTPEEATRPGLFRARLARRAGVPPQSGGGELVLDRYRLLERLGAGGFGVVWRARDELLHREVAVKRIWLGPDGDGDRAAREAQATARLSHPAIVALYEACPQGEAFYLISELVHGPTLGRLIAEDALEDRQIAEIGLALSDALQHAHARGVIHRDIKPQNVLIPEPAQSRSHAEPFIAAKLTDFGGASIAEEDALTRTGDVLGTLAYMAPEQSEGREVGEQADLYALALVLYESLSGVNPVRGSTTAATARRIGTRLESLRRHRRDLPRPLIAAIDLALAPAPADRGALADLREALQDGVDAGERDGPRRFSPAPRWEQPLHEARPPRRHPQLPTPAHSPQPTLEAPPPQAPREAPSPARGLPRMLWAGLGLAGVLWLVAAGQAGAALLLVAALAPLAAMPLERASGRLSGLWLSSLLAPVLGLAGLAGAYPALAGQARRASVRLALGALGYWWLVLAEPLLARHLWLGPAAGTPARSAWEGSLGATAAHVIAPLLTLGVLLGALLWGIGALVLPWVVRGRSAALDVVAATVWSAAIVSAAARLDAGLGAAAHPSPRGAVLGAVLGGMVAVGARALRGPV
ncbi:MAG: protein kinase domain-containing protein [Solirubrobacteraceae bacterium]